MLRIFWSLLFSIVCLPVFAGDIWIEVDTQLLTVKVKQDERTLAIFNDISIGRGGAGFKRRRGDDVTPVGHYKISWINEDSRFYRFFGFNYPSIGNARQALQQRLINKKAFQSIKNAHQNNQTPSQRTSLGGQLGIHGLGRGDQRIHHIVNWTHGCIALTNRQIDRLAQWLKVGSLVKVK